MDSQNSGTANRYFDNCFVCGVQVELHLDQVIDGSPYYRELDEDNHAFCQRDHEGVMQASTKVLRWRSSEDRDLMVNNAAAAGMQIGFEMLADPLRAFILDANPLTDAGECEFCHVAVSDQKGNDPDEHLIACVYARVLRVLLGKPIDSGVEY